MVGVLGAGGSHSKSEWALSLGALGVVFGDIGTSPLYALRECFTHNPSLGLTEDNILGVLSLIFWTLVVVINIKYMWFVMRADNKGEGGILSLMALATAGTIEESRRRIIFLMMGIFGAALLFGDGIITPAITVLSAVEGLQFATPVFSHYVIPITCLIIAGMFLVQRFGTARIGSVFGPIILVWFLAIAAAGIGAILDNPHVLMALNPYYAIEFFHMNGSLSLIILGTVVLVVTGGEALYADMGHFGKTPVRRAWFAVAFPCLVLNYLGQGAFLLKHPEGIQNPFYLMVPEWGQVGMVILATLAAIIASQALISGVFSLSRQAVQMGFSPRMSIIHTSSREIGQIYIPFINWAMMIGVLWLVFTFKNSSNLASAYGVAVTATMTITTILLYFVARHQWGWPRPKTLAMIGVFLFIDLSFLFPNLLKIESGGWVPLVVGSVIYLLMSTWRKGRRILANHLKERSISIEDFLQKITMNPPLRVPGSAIYMSGELWGVPVPLLHNLKHNKVLHETIALLTIKTVEVPFVGKKERVKIDTLGSQFYRIVADYGFMETPKIKHILEACRDKGIPFSIQETTFVLGRETILPTGDPNLPVWREKIFAVMSRNAERPTAFFKIPPNQVIEVGIQVEM